MEGVGSRLGRSSTRYGPVAVFTGPVRKWKKKWVHVSPSSGNKKEISAAVNGAINGGSCADASNGSHLLLYKWTPLYQSKKGNGNSNGCVNGDVERNSPSDDVAAEDPPRRRFKYVPIALLEEQNKETTDDEAAENDDEEVAPNNIDTSLINSTTKKDGYDEKPDINDVPMEENQEDMKLVRQDLNESTLDLSLDLNTRDDDSKIDQTKEGTVEV